MASVYRLARSVSGKCVDIRMRGSYAAMKKEWNLVSVTWVELEGILLIEMIRQGKK